MPYITDKERTERFKYHVVSTRESIAIAVGSLADNGGQLNYMISLAISEYLKIHGLKYNTCQDILGMLEVAKAEFTARVVIPYEKLKAKENGDDIYNWVDEEIQHKWLFPHTQSGQQHNQIFTK